MGTGGVRSGAGRPGHKLLSGNTCRINVNDWHRRGYLRADVSFTWGWSRDGKCIASIDLISDGAGLTLCYRMKVGDDWRDVSQHVGIESTPCHLGGTRPWFTCPTCGGRAGVLFLRSGRYACRKCQRIAYRSQSGSETERLCSLFHKLAAQLEAGKPAWQRWATFERLGARYETVGRRLDASLLGVAQRLGFDLPV